MTIESVTNEGTRMVNAKTNHQFEQTTAAEVRPSKLLYVVTKAGSKLVFKRTNLREGMPFDTFTMREHI